MFDLKDTHFDPETYVDDVDEDDVSNSSEEDIENLRPKNRGRPNLKKILKCIAVKSFNYMEYKKQPDIEKDRRSEHYLRHKLKDTTLCPSGCGAIKFANEGRSFCCGGGNVGFALPQASEVLTRLLTDSSEKGKHFRTHVRAYNTNLAMASVGVHLDQRYNNGIVCRDYVRLLL